MLLKLNPDANDERIWGATLAGFERIVDAQGNKLLVRQDLKDILSIAVCRQAGDGGAGFHGRERLKSLRLKSGETALIRPYRHGGFFRHVTGAFFLAQPPRPFRELTITEELRRRGFPTVEVYGACIEPVWGPVYRGWIVTRELEGAQDLWAALRSGWVVGVGMEKILRAVARALRALHRQGVYHRDLNLKNILLRQESDGVKGYIIDFDKAMLMLGPVPAALAKKNLARLLRSARKLDPEQRYLTSADWQMFVDCYDNGERREI
jgi:hypothetical protein